MNCNIRDGRLTSNPHRYFAGNEPEDDFSGSQPKKIEDKLNEMFESLLSRSFPHSA